jgi:hypothetical protein
MTVERSVKSMLLAAALALAIPAGCFFWRAPGPELSASEKTLEGISCTPVFSRSPGPAPSFSGLDWPVGTPMRPAPAAGHRPQGFPPAPLLAALPAARFPEPARTSLDRPPTLSMIYHEGSLKSALIDDRVIHEGSRVGDHLVLRIEPSGVLLRKAGKDTWLSLDQ